ncbi:hypothetical protein CEUSTIGMA_g1805.t1 [Chlamydomonas eustigma]|uniref:Uncharacterized protein n=1 Tax=Chlamydomonas eustigma TaxID=1157962 RepID=A0A250WUB2_9CHLO|nr:hypothetical protein CEUSTIGMA_g1805.t1 [Chlamydomonas eustigma]|eukprot:GAX74356.1 hypothetical protein CEUSTIGMA_g1805.t1 [Chlamydomonas eustigma]
MVTQVSANTSSSSTPSKPTSYRISLFDAMKFNGPAPELINGRLAMVGLLAAAQREMECGELALSQLQHISLGTCALLLVGVVYASLVPITKGVKQEAFGPFSPRAETTNGRAAMLGFAVLCALESAAGVSFF